MAVDNDQDQGSVWKSVKGNIKKMLDFVDMLFEIENHRFLVGLNSGLVAAVITTSYRNPKLALAARILLPPVCGMTASKSWEHLITTKLETKDLECSVCTYMRGFLIATMAATILPLTFGGIIIARRSRGVLGKAEQFTESFSDNFIQRPILVAAVLAQGGIGYIMASREFERTLIKRLYSEENEHQNGSKTSRN